MLALLGLALPFCSLQWGHGSLLSSWGAHGVGEQRSRMHSPKGIPSATGQQICAITHPQPSPPALLCSHQLTWGCQ